MTTVRNLAQLPPGMTVVRYEAALARFANELGMNIEKSPDPRMPLHYVLTPRYVPNKSQPLPAA